MDIKTVIRAASQGLKGMVKKADTGNYYRPWGFNADGSVRQPQTANATNSVQKPAKAFWPGETNKTNLGASGVNGVELAQAEAQQTGANRRNWDIGNKGKQAQDNAELGIEAATGRGKMMWDGTKWVVQQNFDQRMAGKAAQQFANKAGKNWLGVYHAGANAGINRGAVVTSKALDKHRASQLTPEQLAQERQRVADAQRAINNGTGINMSKRHSGFKNFWGMFGSQNVDVNKVYQALPYGQAYSPAQSPTPVNTYGINANNEDAVTGQTQIQPVPKAGDVRDIKERDVLDDLNARANHMYNFIYGPNSYDKVMQERYYNVLNRLNQMRNNPTYYNNNTNQWTQNAFDYLGNDNYFKDIVNNTGSSQYDPESIKRMFMSNANEALRTNEVFVPKPTGI